MEGLSQLLKTLKLIQKRLNTDLVIEGVLLTMYDKRNNLSSQVEAEVRQVLGDKVFETVIPRNVKLSEAPSHGKPVILYDIGSTGANAYLELAQKLIKRNTVNEKARKSDDSSNKNFVSRGTSDSKGEGVQAW